MLNRTIITGRLTRDPDLRVSQSNISVVNFTVAVNRNFTDSNGERGTEFINVVAFRKQAENVNQYVKKGSLVGIDGRLQSRTYQDKDNKTVYVTEVIADSVQFLEPKSQNNNNKGQGYQNYGPTPGGKPQESRGTAKLSAATSNNGNSFNGADGPVDINDEDLPF